MNFQWWKKFTVLALLGLIACLNVGCPAGKYTGGGFIPSTEGGGKKATFGFNFEGVDQDDDGLVDQVVAPVYDEDGNLLYFAVWWLGEGQFQYHDHGNGVKIHFDCDLTTSLPENWDLYNGDPWPDSMYGEIDIDHYIATGEVVFFTLNWSGQYTSQAGTGTVTVALTAAGDGINGVDDTIAITLSGGPYDGYHNAGTLQGGNIQWHPSN